MFEPLTPPDQTSSSDTPKKKTLGKQLATTIVLAAILMIGASLLHHSKVFAIYETSVYIVLVSSPFGFFLYHRIKNWITATLGNASKYNGAIAFSAFFCLLVLIAALSYNVYMDSSLPDKKSFTVIDKSTRSGKSSKYYYADIQRPDFVQTPFSFFSTESIRITKSEYDRLIPNATRISLSYHMGELAIPWYDDYALNGLGAAPVAQPIQPTARHTESDVQTACLWKSTFNADTDIGKITPDKYFRDYWDNKHPRSVEPLVRGQRHGIAHYTFANGGIYADIPWKHGQKHGVFTLYRDDGTREQTLSYKDGTPFGIQEWYDTNGTLSKSYLYMGDGNTQNPSVCASSVGTH